MTPATTRSDRFAACLAFTWRPDNDGQPLHTTPGDEGGATAWGVTIGSFAAWRTSQGRPRATVQDLARATRAELAELIRANYWNAVQADRLPLGVDLLAYDFAFGSGPGASARLLQEALGIARDGDIGPVTLAAARRASRLPLIRRLGALHQSFYAQLEDYARFGRGWSRRNAQRLALALQS